MDIRVLNSLVGEDDLGTFQYGKGDHRGVPDKRAARLVKSGRAIPIPTAIQTTELPRPAVEKRNKRK
jgi:hypothetical protein